MIQVPSKNGKEPVSNEHLLEFSEHTIEFTSDDIPQRMRVHQPVVSLLFCWIYLLPDFMLFVISSCLIDIT
jgi:hypothetical protein